MLTLLKYIDKFNKFLTYFVGILLGIMSIIIIFQVFSRFALGLPLAWSEETARYMMAYTVFIGAALALRKQSLIGVEAIAERISRKARRLLKTIVYSISIVFFILLIVKGIEMMEKVSTQLTPALQIPMSVPYAAIPIGATLLIMNSIAVLIELYTEQDQPQDQDEQEVI